MEKCPGTKTAHQFSERCSGLGGEDGAGVAKVVPTKVLAAGGPPGRVVDLAERRGPHVEVAVVCGREQQGVLPGAREVLEVALHRRQEMRRDRDVTHPASDFGKPTIICPSARTTARRILGVTASVVVHAMRAREKFLR